MPWSPLRYRGHLEGQAQIVDAHGRVLARRAAAHGPGVVVADVAIGRVRPTEAVPEDFWLHRRGAMAAFAWSYQRRHGRRHYRRHVAPI
jgi:hypothetical protein